MRILALSLTLVGSLVAAEPPTPTATPTSARPHTANDKGADFLFDALDRRPRHALTRRELAVFLDPPAFRPRMLRQVRRKMGFFGKLPGMQGLLDTFGKEPPFARRNHRLWVEEFDRDDDGALNAGERALAAGVILARHDADEDEALDRVEFSEMLKKRRAQLAARDAAGAEVEADG